MFLPSLSNLIVCFYRDRLHIVCRIKYMNIVKNKKLDSVYIVTTVLSIICLRTHFFFPRGVWASSAYQHLLNNYEINIEYQNNFDEILYAQSDTPILTNPDWVPPVNRNKYTGYQIMEDAKKTSESWKYSTNRQGGNIKGGGTVKYKDYRSLTRQTRPESGGGTGQSGK